MQVSLESIAFNHDPTSAMLDAINIRKNEKELVSVPEWPTAVKGGESLAAYAISETYGNTITIQAKFKRLDSNIKALEIRAIDPAHRQLLSEVGDWIDDLFSWLMPPSVRPVPNVLGRVKRRRITFSKDETDFETFELENVRIWDTGVSVSTTTWIWQYRLNSDSPWIDFETSRHRIYTVLKMPKGPWLQYPDEHQLTQLPWADVLEYACTWASGAKNVDSAASRITNEVRNLETRFNLTYDPSSFYSLPDFDCAKFLDLLKARPGMGSKLNCSDCATVVSTFANILGCELWQSHMSGGGSFFTNPIRLFGRTCWQGVQFTVHEVAWKGACTEDDEVFDACLLIDGDNDPLNPPHIAKLARNMRFGRPFEKEYLFHMAAPIENHPGSILPTPVPARRCRRRIRPHKGAKTRLDRNLLISQVALQLQRVA